MIRTMGSNKFGLYLLKQSTDKTKEHLLSDRCESWFSGYLSPDDISSIEFQTKRRVLISVESGEYFFKLGEEIK